MVGKNELRVCEYLVSVPCRGTTFLNSWSCCPPEVQTLFPSPVGELHFSILPFRYSQNSLSSVSVPCRGTTFLNQETKRVKAEEARFPSPVGELHFSILGGSLRLFPDKSFRPLSGNYISQWKISQVYWLSRAARFPSPVGELHFSIPSLQSRHQSGLMVGIAWEKYFWKNK